MERQQTLLKNQIAGQVKFEWRKYVKVDWTQEEDQLLNKIVTCSRKKVMWSRVSRQLNSDFHMKEVRTGKQCKKRWLGVLLPLKNYEWNEEKDQTLLRIFGKFGAHVNLFYEQVQKEIRDLNKDQIRIKLNNLIKTDNRAKQQENILEFKFKHQNSSQIEQEVSKKQKLHNTDMEILCCFLSENL